MSRFKGFKNLADYIDSAPGNPHTCIGCDVWKGTGCVFNCPKGGLVHRAQVMKCHSQYANKVQGECDE